MHCQFDDNDNNSKQFKSANLKNAMEEMFCKFDGNNDSDDNTKAKDT